VAAQTGGQRSREAAIPPTVGTTTAHPPIAWSILLALSAVRLGLYFLSNGLLAYGLMTDELY
jgi:hypothetical protein